MLTSSGIRTNEVSTSSGISPKSPEINQPSYRELDLIYGDGPAECAERLNINFRIVDPIKLFSDA